MPVSIHGKQYNTVAERVNDFREKYPHWTIKNKIIHADDEKVIVKSSILDDTGRMVADGHAEEVRGSSNINSTSALENAETSACGRALSFFGLAGTEIASADEVANAIKQQHEKEIFAQWARHTEFVEKYREGLENIRDRLADDDFEAAREQWNTLDNETMGSPENHEAQKVLWRATTKGGWFTPRERQQMKYWSNDFENGRKG